LAITAIIESITRSDAMRNFFSSSGVFTARSRSSTNTASTISLSGKALRSAVPASTGRNASSAAIRLALTPERRT
jgi:hypothetical protein